MAKNGYPKDLIVWQPIIRQFDGIKKILLLLGKISQPWQSQSLSGLKTEKSRSRLIRLLNL